jgi:polyribonucleotide nucleotidyltransferase
LTVDILEDAITQAREGRLHILSVMKQAIAQPRESLSKYAPRITSFSIDPEKIGAVIGSGGKVINEIVAETGVKIDIDDSGLIMITSTDGEGAARAEKWIKDLVREVKAGEEFKGTVTRLMDFGAFVEILPGKEGLVHVSKLSADRVENVADAVKVGDMLDVVVTEVDSQGRINLITQVALAAGKGTERPERRPRTGSSDRNRPRGGNEKSREPRDHRDRNFKPRD